MSRREDRQSRRERQRILAALPEYVLIPVEEPPGPEPVYLPEGQLVGRVGVWTRKNIEGGRTYYLRWYVTDGQGGTRQAKAERLFRTERDPDRSSRRQWLAKARLAARAKQQELALDEAPRRRPPKYALNYAANNYLQWLAGDEMHDHVVAQSTLDARVRVVWSFVNYVGEQSPHKRWCNQLSANDPAGWALWRSKTVADTTLNTELFHLGGFLAWCYDHHYIREYLSLKTQRKRCQYRRPVVLEDPEIAAILNEPAMYRQTRAGLWILGTLGLRPGELASLQTDGWHADRRTIHVPAGERERTKWHERTLPVGPRLGELLDELDPQNGQLFPGLDRHTPAVWLRRWDGVSPKRLRQWVCTTLERLEAPDYIIRAIMGHAPDSTRGHYAATLRPSDLRPWVERVESVLARETAEPSTPPGPTPPTTQPSP